MASKAPLESASSSYIDFPTLTSPSFSPHTHANSLILATNNTSDSNIDLTTPLSRALFDLQEIDTHIHTLTSRSALDILSYTQTQNVAAQKILSRVDEERTRLVAGYEQLEREVLDRYQKAKEAKVSASRSWEVLKLGRSVQKVLGTARQFELLIADSGLGGTKAGKEDHRALLRAAHVVLTFRESMSMKDNADLSRINLIRTIRGRVFEDGEARILDYARRIVREFAMSSLTSPNVANASFREAEDNKSRFTNAVYILYLLSPAPLIEGQKMKVVDFEPEYLLRALQGYLQNAITASSANIGRALSQLPTLERTLVEVSARCQNVTALQSLLGSIQTPPHSMLQGDGQKGQTRPGAAEIDELDLGEEDNSKDNLLQPLLQALDTSSLPSYFWRSLASSLSTRVQDLLNRGGVVARTLRSQRDSIRNDIRECVLRGSKMPQALLGGDRSGGEEIIGNWEREAAVMVGSVVGLLGR